MSNNTQQKITLVGFAVDEGVIRNNGRQGAHLGPKAIREEFFKLKYDPQNRYRINDLGDLTCENNDLEVAQKSLAKLVANQVNLNQDNFSVVLGGGHETAYGHYLGLSKAYPNENIAIINFDAHFDLRPLINKDGKNFGSSGTPFTQIAQYCAQNNLDFNYNCFGIQNTANSLELFERAKDLKVNYLTNNEILNDASSLDLALQQIMANNQKIYVTVCLDVFDSSIAKGVSAPQVNGLFAHHVINCLIKLAQSGKVVGLDFVECAPNLDSGTQTAKLAAVCLAEFLHATEQ